MGMTESFTCPECGEVSYNPNDIENGYCGVCHWWTGDPILGGRNPIRQALYGNPRRIP